MLTGGAWDCARPVGTSLARLDGLVHEGYDTYRQGVRGPLWWEVWWEEVDIAACDSERASKIERRRRWKRR
jgi:hypothetical protein